MSLQGIAQDDPRPLLDVIRLVHHVALELHDRRRVDRLFQHLRQVLDGLFQVGLVVLEDGGRVALFQAVYKHAKSANWLSFRFRRARLDRTH